MRKDNPILKMDTGQGSDMCIRKSGYQITGIIFESDNDEVSHSKWESGLLARAGKYQQTIKNVKPFYYRLSHSRPERISVVNYLWGFVLMKKYKGATQINHPGWSVTLLKLLTGLHLANFPKKHPAGPEPDLPVDQFARSRFHGYLKLSIPKEVMY